MIFQPQLARLVVVGRKTQTRRIVKPGEAGAAPRCYYRAGSSYPLERPLRDSEMTQEEAIRVGSRRGRPPKKRIGRLKITDVRLESVGSITEADARCEGFSSIEAFKSYWVGLHEPRWPGAVNAWCPDCLLNDDFEAGIGDGIWCSTCDDTEEITLIPEPTDRQRAERFDARHADTLVWVITFELDDTPMMLALEPGRTGDYVDTEYDERGNQVALLEPIDGWANARLGDDTTGSKIHQVPQEVVNPEIIDAWSKDPNSTHEQIKRGIVDRKEHAEAQRALDRRLLSFEDRIRRARAAAKLSSINVTSEVRALRAAQKRRKSDQHIEKLVCNVERRAYRETGDLNAA